MYNLFWALLILFLFGSLLRMDWVYYLVYVLGGVWLLSHWWVRRSLGLLTVERRMDQHAFLGERIPVQVRLSNQSWLPLPWLLIQELAPLDLKDATDYTSVLSVASRARIDHAYTFHAKRRGYYTVGPLTLRTGDLFGFVEANWQEQGVTHVTVYPRVLPLSTLRIPSRSPFGILPSRQRLFEDPARLAGVRAYTNGDSQRAIHWKASAHSDALLVKKFQPAIALNVTLILDLNRRAYPAREEFGLSEWAIEVAASLASYIISQRQPVGMITNGKDSVVDAQAAPLAAHNGQGQLMSLLTALARVQMHEFEHDLAAWLPGQINDLEWGATLMVVTPKLDEAALWVLHNAYRRGSNIIVLLCAPQAELPALQARARRLGVAVHRVVWEKDLETLVL